MARLIYGLQQSLDGYVDHRSLGPPGPAAFRYFLKRVRHSAGIIYGGTTYMIMRYWDERQAGWGEAEAEFAEAWRRRHKFVVSASLGSVGPNATLIPENVEEAIRELKAAHEGEMDVAGPTLAATLGECGLIDEYHLYLRPMVLGGGTKFFARARPALKFAGSEEIGDGMIRLRYVVD